MRKQNFKCSIKTLKHTKFSMKLPHWHQILVIFMIYALLSRNFDVGIYALFPQIFGNWKVDSADFFTFRMYGVVQLGVVQMGVDRDGWVVSGSVDCWCHKLAEMYGLYGLKHHIVKMWRCYRCRQTNKQQVNIVLLSFWSVRSWVLQL